MFDALFYKKYGRLVAQALMKKYYASVLSLLHSESRFRQIFKIVFINRA
jgi:hypothetical protein